MKTDLLTLIVTYNGMKWIEKCIESVMTSSAISDIYVVDNGSTDGTLDYLKMMKEKGELDYYQSPENLGFGAANNLGFKYAEEHDYTYVYLLNQDAWVERGTLAHLKTVIGAYPEVGVLSPVQLQADGKTMDKQFKKRCGKYLKAAKKDPEYNAMRPVQVPFVMAAHWMLRMDTIKKFHGFGRVFYMNGEDDDFCNRVRYKDMQVCVVPCIHAIHDRGDRKISKDKRIYLKYIGCVAFVCDPENPFPDSVVMMTCKLFLICFKCFSLQPLKYIWKLWMRARELGAYRRETREFRMFKAQ